MYGVRKRVVTPSARVRANHIVLACNVHLGSLLPRVAGTLIPVWAYVMVTAPLGPRLDAAIGYRGAVTDTELARSHYRVVDGDRLLWSGRATTWESDPSRFVKSMQADIAGIYPQLGEVEVEQSGRACSAIRCTACRRSGSCRRGCGLPAASAATASTPPPWPAW